MGLAERSPAPRYLVVMQTGNASVEHVFAFTPADVERVVKAAVTEGGFLPKDVTIYERSGLEPRVEVSIVDVRAKGGG